MCIHSGEGSVFAFFRFSEFYFRFGRIVGKFVCTSISRPADLRLLCTVRLIPFRVMVVRGPGIARR